MIKDNPNGKYIGIHPNELKVFATNYETGKAVPSSKVLIKIAQATNKSVSEITKDTQKEYSGYEKNKKIEKLEQRISNLEQIVVELIKKKN